MVWMNEITILPTITAVTFKTTAIITEVYLYVMPMLGMYKQE